MTRPSNRAANQLRPVSIDKDFTIHAEGSVLISCGNTKVLCNASIENNVPRFLKGKGQGWVTAEYGMLPRHTLEWAVKLPEANNQDAPKKFNA